MMLMMMTTSATQRLIELQVRVDGVSATSRRRTLGRTVAQRADILARTHTRSFPCQESFRKLRHCPQQLPQPLQIPIGGCSSPIGDPLRSGHFFCCGPSSCQSPGAGRGTIRQQ